MTLFSYLVNNFYKRHYENTLTNKHNKKITGQLKGLYTFPKEGTEEPYKDLKRFWTKILQEARIENFRIHYFRHTNASHWVSKGLGLRIVGRLLGHTQASTTQRYHLADQPLRDAANMFAKKVL